MGTPWRDHCHDTLTLVLSAVTSALTLSGVGISTMAIKCHVMANSDIHTKLTVAFTSNKHLYLSAAHCDM